MEISLVMPNRNNLKYFKWAYESIRKNQGDHKVWICSAADACTDGTVEYYEELAKIDPYFKYIVNKGSDRLGHTILYDKIIWDLVETDLAMIFHSDMYLCPGALDAIERRMFGKEPRNGEWITVERKKTIISLTRIEPPLHPAGKEKIVRDFGTEPENFDEQKFLNFHYGIWNPPGPGAKLGVPEEDINLLPDYLKTCGIFAPWCFWVNEFKEIGGHDSLFSPQSKEDSDIFNRFKLNGTEFLQTWEGFVYHMTCRGSRFNPTITTIGKNSAEWETQNMKSSRNFIRKWGHFVRHDEYLKPEVPHKYDIACIIKNCNYNLMANLEPWFSELKVDSSVAEVLDYIDKEQPNTRFELINRVGRIQTDLEDRHDIICYIDGHNFTGDDFYYIQYLSDIITQNNPDDGCDFEIGNIRLKVNRKKTYERELIVCKNEPIIL